VVEVEEAIPGEAAAEADAALEPDTSGPFHRLGDAEKR
jgi:hypothetical protein